jgi:hypothetical protein
MSLVNCDTLAEVKFDVVRPDTVSAPEATERPEPVRLVMVLVPTPRRVVERLVVVAFVDELLVKSALVKCDVEDAKMPLVRLIVVEVELTPTP